MDAICGVLGKCEVFAVRRMAHAMNHRGTCHHMLEGDNFAVTGGSPVNHPAVLIDGAPRLPGGGVLSPDALAEACLKAKAPDALRLQGAFAAAVQVGDTWWLIRDRVGIKPLYYYHGPGWLAFASELKGLLASGLVPRRVDEAAIDGYLTLRCVPGTSSIIEGVKRVAPGSVVCFSPGKITEFRYEQFNTEPRRIQRSEAAEQLQSLLRDSVQRSDTSACLWSAGIDCAAIAALRPDPTPVFVALKSTWQDEAWRARESARILHLKLKVLKPHSLTEAAFQKMIYHLDEPIADASALPLWMIAEQVSSLRKPINAAHGADELLGGYPRFHFLQKAQGVKGVVPVQLLTGLLPALPPNVIVRRSGGYLASIGDNLDSYLSLLAVFSPEEREELYSDRMKASLRENHGSSSVLKPHFTAKELTHNLLLVDLNVALPDLLLMECDRTMAAHGVQLRFPYLDDAIVEFALSLPANVKFGLRSKPVLREAMKGILPARLRQRARRGFRVPQSGPSIRLIESIARSTVTKERVLASGLFNWRFVEQIMSARTHNVYRRRQFWALLMLFAWYRQYMEA